jgi:hypothetical protein
VVSGVGELADDPDRAAGAAGGEEPTLQHEDVADAARGERERD